MVTLMLAAEGFKVFIGQGWSRVSCVGYYHFFFLIVVFDAVVVGFV